MAVRRVPQRRDRVVGRVHEGGSRQDLLLQPLQRCDQRGRIVGLRLRPRHDAVHYLLKMRAKRRCKVGWKKDGGIALLRLIPEGEEGSLWLIPEGKEGSLLSGP